MYIAQHKILFCDVTFCTLKPFLNLSSVLSHQDEHLIPIEELYARLASNPDKVCLHL